MTLQQSNHEEFMRLAIAKAKEGVAAGQTPFGACIVKEGRVIACCHNEVWLSTDITAHAEMVAIRQACRALKTIDLSGCVIYSTCEPCPMCFSTCHWAKIDRIISGTRVTDAQDIGFNELKISNEEMKRLGQSPVDLLPDFLRHESMEVFRLWHSQANRRAY